MGSCSIVRRQNFSDVMMTKNPILEGIRQTRERLLAESGGTLAGLVDRLQAEEKASGRTIRKTQRTNGGDGGATSGVLPIENLSPSKRSWD